MTRAARWLRRPFGSPVLLALVAGAAAGVALRAMGADLAMDSALRSMPPGYSLQYYDDCGVSDRQPHMRAEGVHQYSSAAVNAGEQARTVAWGWKEVRAVYEDLVPGVEYVVAVAYANEPYNHRVQSLWAGGTVIHGPRALPRGGVERLLFRVPVAAIRQGRLDLSFRLEAEVNVVVSVVELWAPLPPRRALHLPAMSALLSDLEGSVLSETWDPVLGASVSLFRAGSKTPLASVDSGLEGRFSFARSLFEGARTDLLVVAAHEGLTARAALPADDLSYSPPRFHPIPASVPGLRIVQVSLDGQWRLDPDPGKSASAGTPAVPLTAPRWRPFQVPGQFVQQGFEVPQDRTVAVAREFTVPAAWAGRRVFLRFDAVHASTRYQVNGRPLGASENLFTPVEFEITDLAKPGLTSRLDLEMKVDSLAERMSSSSGYAFHSLGGIDRSVRLFALPRLHIRDLRLQPGLDGQCRNGTLRLEVGLDNPDSSAAQGLALDLKLQGPSGQEARLSAPRTEVGPLAPGRTAVTLTARVPAPLQWSAEKPSLYRLVLSLRQGRRVLERVERDLGFRRIEIRGSQLYVNGARVKLAGACHHEIDPLTGRAGTARWAKEDIRLLKAANLNYLRTSHYPPTQELLEEADRQGMYVEVEAPFCWVGDDHDQSHLRTVLDPTAAMVDYHHAHPSVLVWSLANESEFNPLFERSAQLVKWLDPTRPTTFNNPDPQRRCDIANLHYAGMPYDQHLPGDPRPLFLGEYFFPICHEQTDVRVDPGLRELWGAGHSDPDSPWGRDCAASFSQPYPHPGNPPGAWTSLVRSDRFIGGAIWAAIDDTFYLPEGRNVGYSWVHGFWGLIDAWRRPKPEWWLAKLMFSPVWFPVRQVDFTPNDSFLTLPVENRYSFTDLSELGFAWEFHGTTGRVATSAPPGQRGVLKLPWPGGAKAGDVIVVRALDSHGSLITPAAIQLGPRPARPLPQPSAGLPAVAEEGETITVTGDGFCLVLDRRLGQLVPGDPRFHAPVREFPQVHATRFDFGDLVPGARPYAVLPDPRTRVVESVDVRALSGMVEIAVRDRYDGLVGSVRWLLDRKGMSHVVADYQVTGDGFDAREVGLRFLLAPECQTLSWDRWSEWGIYPEDSLSRTRGTAQAHRTPPAQPGDDRREPTWPWSQDETELGTADFRGVKLNVFEAALTSPRSSGLRVHADADRHVRACLGSSGIWLHVLTQCRLGPVSIKRGQPLTADAVVELVPGAK